MHIAYRRPSSYAKSFLLQIMGNILYLHYVIAIVFIKTFLQVENILYF